MADLFTKLNALVRSSIEDLVGDIAALPRRAWSSRQLGPDIEREIAALRERINDALAYEDTLRAKLDTLRAEAERLDRQADAAVADGRDDQARLLLAQTARAEQRATIAANDLREHQLVTQELIQRVNTLDAVVAEARRAEAEAEAPSDASGGVPPDDSEAAAAAKNVPSLSDVLRQARETIAGLGEQTGVAAPTPDAPPADPAAVEDDLARRRQRLSK